MHHITAYTIISATVLLASLAAFAAASYKHPPIGKLKLVAGAILGLDMAQFFVYLGLTTDYTLVPSILTAMSLQLSLYSISSYLKGLKETAI